MKKLNSIIISILIAVLLISTYLISNSQKKDFIKDADLLLDMMEYKAAIFNYMKALSEDSLQRDIRKNIGYAYFQLERIDEALKYIKEELSIFPDNGDAYGLLIYVLFKLNRPDEAHDLIRNYEVQFKPEEDNPNCGLGDFIFGIYFKDKKEYREAKNSFRRAGERGYQLLKCYVQMADIELTLGNRRGFLNVIAGAKEKHAKLYEIHTTQYELFEFYFMYGLLYYAQFKLDIGGGNKPLYLHLSYERFKEALKLKPDSKDTLFNLACITYNYRQFKEASQYFEKILDIEPGNTEVAFYLDCCLEKLNKPLKEKMTTVQCPKALNLSKDFIENPEIEYKYQFKNDLLSVFQNIQYLALDFVKQGKLDAAIKRYHNGLKIYEESPGINFNLGMVYFWQDNFKEAEKHALMALRRKYFYATRPDILSPGRLRDRKRAEAIRKGRDVHESPDIPISKWTFDVALKDGNYFIEAYDLLGNIYFKKGEINKSVIAFKKSIEIQQKDAMGHYNLGCSYLHLNDWDNAEKEWKKAIKYEKESKKIREREKISKDQLEVSLIVVKRPVSFRARKSLGQLYVTKNLPEKALKEFKKAIKLEPDDPEPYYELGNIYNKKSEHNEKYVRKAVFYYEKYLYLGGEKEEEVKVLLKPLK
jgi:tetratricopeptide (TPR) repeat protein